MTKLKIWNTNEMYVWLDGEALAIGPNDNKKRLGSALKSNGETSIPIWRHGKVTAVRLYRDGTVR